MWTHRLDPGQPAHTPTAFDAETSESFRPGGMTQPLTGDDGLPAPTAGEFPEKGVVHWKSFLSWDESSIAAAARSRMAIFPIQICLSDAGGEIMYVPTLRTKMGLYGSGQIVAVSSAHAPHSAAGTCSQARG